MNSKGQTNDLKQALGGRQLTGKYLFTSIIRIYIFFSPSLEFFSHRDGVK